MTARRALVARPHELAALTEKWLTLGITNVALRATAARYGHILLLVARTLDTGTPFPSDAVLPPVNATLWEMDAQAALRLERMRGGRLEKPRPLAPEKMLAQTTKPGKHRFFVDDAFTNPEHVRFALTKQPSAVSFPIPHPPY